MSYCVKTPGLPPPGPAHSHSLSNPPPFLPTKSSTPLASPRLPYSVGQPHPPKLSPSAGRISARAPSPNYFGLSVETTDTRDSTAIPRDNWSPPSSSVRSFAAALPKQLPMDANPEFDAFRRQIDANRGGAAFNLSTSHFAGFGSSKLGELPTSAPPVPSALMRPRLTRWHTHSNDASETPRPRISGLPANGAKESVTNAPASRMDADTNSLPDSAYVSLDSKRNSESSMEPPPSILNMSQFESPAQLESPFAVPERRRSHISSSEPHPSPPKLLSRLESPPMKGSVVGKRADSAPLAQDGGPSMMPPSQLKELIEYSPESEVLVLDVRVSPQYAQCRIKGALNLCIPTTLLKRATFNLQKLQQTFQGDHTREKFANWRNTTHLVVYDASSPERRDAVSAVNMLKKFSDEGYTGSMNILRGGFNAFAAAYPDLVDHSSTRAPASLSLGANTCSDGAILGLAPVIGGVMLPNSVNKSNPFFSNIRQNQDLVDGVGQLDIAIPTGLDLETLPQWLKDVAVKEDHGKKASDKFLKIELDERSRMMDAFSVFNPSTSTADLPEEQKVQLSGVEKGGKNRYKDILPFDHARVRLEGRAPGGCDYINASHLKASRSHKRYIATQGPLPATFEDFWSVIWEQDVRVIVMLTAESEGGQLKCHPYWTDKEFGPMKLRSLSEKKVSLDIDKHRSHSTVHPQSSQSSSSSSNSSQSSFSWNISQAEIGRRRANTTTNLESSNPTPAHPNNGNPAGAAGETPYVIIRKFALSHTAHPFSPMREITHLHYPSWPDFGAPAEPSHLLALVELANVMQRAALPINGPEPTPTSELPPSDEQPSLARVPSIASIANKRSNSDALPIQWHDSPEPSDHARPMLVHCSAGCGRTGAFCTIDSVLDMLKRQRQRAVGKANRKLAEGEKRIAADQQLMGEGLREKRRAVGKGSHDGDGDVDMTSPPDDEAVSPLATFCEPPLSHLEGWPDVANPPQPPTAPTTEDEDDEEDAEGIDTTWLDDEAVDLVARTVTDFRGQRLSMVQSLRQFVLCYEAILEWVWRLQQRGSGAGVAGRGRARSGSLAM